MRSFLVALGVSVLGILTARAVHVEGYCSLAGQQNHQGSKVLFLANSPSAQTDSVYTDLFGYFDLTLQPGVYDVEYSHPTYATYRLANQVLLWDTTLAEAILMPPLSGNLSGALGPGDFQVTDSIVVDSGQSLTILPGTRLFFEGMYPIQVRGRLSAEGTIEDSILFTRRYASGSDTAWGGILFLDADDSCRMEYCCLSRAYRSNGLPYFGNGAAVYCRDSDLEIRSCCFHNNTGSCGVYFQDCAPTVEDCSFEDGMYAYAAVNSSDASPTYVGCLFQNNIYGALDSYGSGQVTIQDCVFRENRVYAHAPTRIMRSVFQAQAGAFNGLLLGREDSVEVSSCTFFGGRGTSNFGLLRVVGAARVSNCAFFVTSGNGIRFDFAQQSQVQYCNIFAPGGQPFLFNADDPSQGPPAIGLIALTNANGDSCDTYYNIFLDPQFADTANGDYHLLATSPCIDAGDPELPNDPDGTVADIGAFYFDQMSAPDPERATVQRYVLMQNYPNPFNSVTQIGFDLPHAGEAQLRVFDVTGRAVKTLAAGPMSAGHHEVWFDAAGLPSGMYFYQLDADAVRQMRKMVLIK